MLIFKPLPFLTLNNQFNILRATSVLAMICIGMTTVVIGRGIDLSVGSVTGLTGGVCAFLLLKGTGMPVAIILALITGIAIGALNGILITKFGLSDFIVTLGTLYLFRGVYLAWAKGLPPTKVIFKHALRNVMIPVVTITGLQFGEIIAFSIVTETIFQWPGMGNLLLTSMYESDRPVVVTYIMMVAVIIITLNIIVDILYAFINPKIRYE